MQAGRMQGNCGKLVVTRCEATLLDPQESYPSGGSGMLETYSVRNAKPEEQRQLTRLCVRATLHAGYDDAFIDRVMPGLTITLPLVAGDYVRVAQDTSGDVVGVVAVTNTALQGIALLYGIYVDPARW